MVRRANPIGVALGLIEGPRVTYGPNGGPTKPKPAVEKKKTRARSKRAAASRRRNR